MSLPIASFQLHSIARTSTPGRRSLHIALAVTIAISAGAPALFAKKKPAAEPADVRAQSSGSVAPVADYDHSHVGPQANGRIIVPTNQVLTPSGRQVIVGGRPTDVALSPDGRWLAVLNLREVQLVNVESGEIVSAVPNKSASFKGIAFAPDGKQLYASTIGAAVGVFNVSDAGKLEGDKPIAIPGKSSRDESVVPVGMSISADGKTMLVVLNMKNSLAEIDLATGKVKREIPVGNAPYDVAVVGHVAYVSNWAGRLPTAGVPTGPSGESPRVRVDAVRNIANDGSVSVVDLEKGRELSEIVVGLHPSGLVATPDGQHLLVANAHSDAISVIETHSNKVVETIATKPAEKLLFGSTPNALAISADGHTVYASNGTNNSIAVVKFDPPNSQLLGCIPTAWYPAGLAIDSKRDSIYVANLKGNGSRSQFWKGDRKVKDKVVFGFNSHDHQGTVSLIKLPTAAELAANTKQVLTNNRDTEEINALAPPLPDAPPRPVPERHGEPSVFKHVVYIIKENRTYDQVFGDIKTGEGDPSLLLFGREVTPNQHKLAEQFVLLDNFYCSGVCSADGHQWTDEAYATDYLEKAFGGWPRSYPYPGGDAMAYAPTGFIWDNALAHKKTLRVYGEFAPGHITWKDPKKAGKPSFIDCYNDAIHGTHVVEVRAISTIKTLDNFICPTATGFPLTVPDIYRAQQFLDEFKHAEETGTFANFTIMLLPANHTMGTRPGFPTPEAAVADNDLALGRIVDAISHSKSWADTCIFVVEDDPQMGFDHIDGHRTVAQVISPYTRRKFVDSTNFNQTSMVRTIELLLGLPPMNQMDSSATPMASCFQEKPDLTPYDVTPNIIPLDQLNPDLKAINNPQQKHWAEESLKLDLTDADRADENTFNRILWHARRGRDDNYPDWAVTATEDDKHDDDD